MSGGLACAVDAVYPHGGVLVPSGAPRGVEGEALNATAVRVKWRAPAPELQHGQIRGYQVHYVRLERGEPQGQPSVKDILMEDSQVRRPLGHALCPHPSRPVVLKLLFH